VPDLHIAVLLLSIGLILCVVLISLVNADLAHDIQELHDRLDSLERSLTIEP